MGNRTVDGGINWIWYHTDTKEDAEKWFEELTGRKPVCSAEIFKWEGRWAFRIHR